MGLSIAEEKNPFAGGGGAFAILRVPINATASQLRDAQDERLADVNERFTGNEAERVKELKRVKDAYETVRTAKGRLAAQFFVLDPEIGTADARRASENARKAPFSYEQIFRRSEQVFRRRPYIGHLTLHAPVVGSGKDMSLRTWDKCGIDSGILPPQTLIEFDR